MSRSSSLEQARWRLYAILDPAALLPGASLLEVAEAALRGGAGVLQLRDKQHTARELVEMARALTSLCERYQALCIVNDRLDVALAAGAHGVHLGPHDIPVEAARRLAPELVIGASAGDEQVAARLVAQGADYLGVGAIFEARPSKADASAPRGVEVLARVRAAVTVPLVGIGGISLENAAQVIEAGADGIAVIRAVCGQPEPEDAARALLEAMRR